MSQIFRTIKTILENRPIYHKLDVTIRGHVFCSFLALVLLKELQARLEQRGWGCKWDRLKMDLDTLQEVTVRAAGVALGPVVRPVPKEPS
ncbi:MAG TPA: hypothetical protein VLI39_09535 [Sedimentisphaerales bacterium]|nr:hypothetical protein [Sedimentisphaerales bacterium]